jgi:hypothetical protein
MEIELSHVKVISMNQYPIFLREREVALLPIDSFSVIARFIWI